MEGLTQFLTAYFMESGLGWAMVGAMLAVMLGGMGSAQGIRVAAGQAAGAMSEKPELFGKFLVLFALPGTQGFYGFVTFFLITVYSGLLKKSVDLTTIQGLSLLAIGFGSGMVYWKSAIYQGETSAACVNLVAKKPEQMGRAIILPAFVETYAVVALLAAILGIIFVTHPDLKLITYAAKAIETTTP